ncbi:hypothetical protein [Actinocrispum wychmicini]|uniref:hypothetical protein n=1 Tax=Actinocrispum wychmicini TaxID=1213861 RepID=UPI001404F2E7|nr:hypothetical protein [Actinocrispum wychmicini]
MTTCPHCAWPVRDLPAERHRTSEGVVDYRRCVCGSWIVLVEKTLTAVVAAE